MRVTEALLRQNNQKKKKPPVEEKEETLRYQDWDMRRWSLNRTESAFSTPFDGGLNTAESVFDRQAVFRTGRE